MMYAKAFSISAAVALAATGLASPAAGKSTRIVVTAPPADLVVRHVSYADLNLASAAGERSLNGRVGYAVSDLCSEATGGNDGSFTAKRAMNRCSGSAWDQARPQMSLAVQRAHEIAATGTSNIAAAALTITLPQ